MHYIHCYTPAELQWVNHGLILKSSSIGVKVRRVREMTIIMTHILLVRHGQTAWNRIDRFLGQADVPLDEVGIAQAESTAQRIASQWRVNAVYSSPISRALNTAQAVARLFNLSVQPHSGLTDINFGLWQGLSPEQVRASWPVEKKPGICEIPGFCMSYV
jgi:hypothetical protein